jgi:P27 family predicted phage terminase small subunit
VRRGPRGEKNCAAVVLVFSAARVSAPDRLSPPAKRLWRRAERELRARGTWRPTCAPLLERMVLNQVAAEEAMERALAEPEVRGSMGQLVQHPAWATAARCDRIALALAVQLGLTPRSTTATAATAPAAPAAPTPADAAAGALDELAKRRRAG